MKLRTKIILFTTAIVAAVFGATFTVVDHQVESATLADNQQHLRMTAVAVQQRMQSTARNWNLALEGLAQSPLLVTALEQRDTRQLAAQTLFLRQHLAATTKLLALTTADGSVLAAEGLERLGLPSLATTEPLRSALLGRTGSTFWVIDRQLYIAIAVPVGKPAKPGQRVGTILAAFAIENNAVQHLRSLIGSDIVLMGAGDVLASSLPESLAREVARQLPRFEGQTPRRVEVRGTPYLAIPQTIPTAFGGRLTQIILRPLEDAEDLIAQIGSGLLVIGIVASLVSFLFAWLGARRITQPLRRLSATMSEMAQTGELQSNFPTAGGDREVQLIENTFRQLLLSLEESQRARERSYVEAVGAVVTAADARDHETTGHSFRVAHYAVALARSMGLKSDQLKAIEWGGLLHDVGKMVVPDDILRKAGALTEDEWHIMRQHPTWGFDMLAEVGFLQQPALEIVYSHHERWDGRGYPRRLAGEAIPLAARIFAAVDTYDAITSDRPYRRAHSHQAAVAELRRVAGQQLDPKVVEAFGAIPEVELRRLRELCRRSHPGLTLPSDLLADLSENPGRRIEEGRAS